ncbi:unnamed protein product, partial [Rotaria magnacalcarata]
RLYGTGVYVNKIRPNGPAELEGTLVPCMRIYKVCQMLTIEQLNHLNT